jgi:hypothetical protein
MLFAVVNLVLTIWLYFFLVMLHDIDCKCALTPTYYFMVYYIILSLLLITFRRLINGNAIVLLSLSLLYFVSTIVFLFMVFKYIREIEACMCVGPNGATVLQMLFWVRVISLAISLVMIMFILSGFRNPSKKVKG